MDNLNFYKIFNIPENATDEQIDKAWRELSFIYHSDKTGKSDSDLKLINHIRNVLKNPKKRAAHNAYIRGMKSNSYNAEDDKTIENQKKIIDTLKSAIKRKDITIQEKEKIISILESRLKISETNEKSYDDTYKQVQEQKATTQTSEKNTNKPIHKHYRVYGHIIFPVFLVLGVLLLILGILLVFFSLLHWENWKDVFYVIIGLFIVLFGVFLVSGFFLKQYGKI